MVRGRPSTLRFCPTGPQPFELELHGRALNAVVRVGGGLPFGPGDDDLADDEGRELGCFDGLVGPADGVPDAELEALAELLADAVGDRCAVGDGGEPECPGPVAEVSCCAGPRREPTEKATPARTATAAAVSRARRAGREPRDVCGAADACGSTGRTEAAVSPPVEAPCPTPEVPGPSPVCRSAGRSANPSRSSVRREPWCHTAAVRRTAANKLSRQATSGPSPGSGEYRTLSMASAARSAAAWEDPQQARA